MKKIWDFIKDLIYDATDYTFIIIVIFVVGVVLIWRFNILFDLEVAKEPIDSNNLPIEEPVDITGSGIELPDKEPTTDPDPTTEQPIDQPTEVEDSFIAISIPAGSFPSDIADLLLDNNLISNKETFLNRAIELDLDRKLKSGDFKIKIGLELDDIIKTIARIN